MLHGAQRYDDATDALQNDTIDAFKMILPEHAFNIQVRGRPSTTHVSVCLTCLQSCANSISPFEAEGAVGWVIDAQMEVAFYWTFM